MLIRIYNENPNERAIDQVVNLLENDGVVIYPTDSVYAFGCSLHSSKALDRIKSIRGKASDDISIVCADLSSIADYAKVDNQTFKLLKRNLPGPFTFILNSSNKVPDRFLARRKEVGVRIPANPIAEAIVKRLGHPMITASVKINAPDIEYITDPELIHEVFGRMVDMVIDGGIGKTMATTVVDCRDSEPVILREGAVELEL